MPRDKRLLAYLASIYLGRLDYDWLGRFFWQARFLQNWDFCPSDFFPAGGGLDDLLFDYFFGGFSAEETAGGGDDGFKLAAFEVVVGGVAVAPAAGVVELSCVD